MWKTWKKDLAIAFITAILSISGTLYVNHRSRESKKPKLGYKRISSISLVSVNKKVKDEVAVSYKRKSIVDLFSFKIGVINTGKVAVKKPLITFELGEGTEIISITSDLIPEDRNREINTTLSDSEIKEKPFIRDISIQFLNEGEAVNFDINAIGYRKIDPSELKIKANIEGVNWYKIPQDKKEQLSFNKETYLIISFLVLIISITFLIILSKYLVKNTDENVLMTNINMIKERYLEIKEENEKLLEQISNSKSLLLSKNKKVTASGKYDEKYEPGNVVNCETGEPNKIFGNYWLLPDNETGWIQIDLEKQFFITKIRLLNTKNSYRCV